jgi:hypothetical protein
VPVELPETAIVTVPLAASYVAVKLERFEVR